MTTRVLAILGSLRERSHNAALLRLAASVAPEITLLGADTVRELPLFDPELDAEDRIPAPVRRFRAAADASSGVVIATPEYAHGPSGTTKNAVDWLVGAGGLLGRPTVLMTATTGQGGGTMAHAALLPTLLMLGAIVVDTVNVSSVAGKVDERGDLVDPDTVDRMAMSMRLLREGVRRAERSRVG